jgi:serine protease Do
MCLLPAVAQQTHPYKIAPTGPSFVGVMVQEIDSERARTLKLPNESGVEITHVEPDSPAEHAGLKVGDAVMQYNGERVEGMEQFSRLVRETPAGREVKFEIVRNGAPQSVMVKVAARRTPGAFMVTPPTAPAFPAQPFELRMPDMPRSFMSWRSAALGIECETLEGQLAQFFGVKEGVLVRSVSKGSPADKGGIKAGDVITRVDDSHVATPADISSKVRSLRGKAVPMLVMRDHKEVNVSVTVEQDDRGDNWWFQNFTPLAPKTPVQ